MGFLTGYTREILAFLDPFQYDWIFFHGNVAPLHFQFHDKDGNSLVMEFRNGKIELIDNSDLGVMTNYPFIEWQRINIDINEGELVDVKLDAFDH